MLVVVVVDGYFDVFEVVGVVELFDGVVEFCVVNWFVWL